jgi:ribosome recycling factor
MLFLKCAFPVLFSFRTRVNSQREDGTRHPALVEDIKVDYFGTQMTVKQLGTVNIPEPRQIAITVWDKGALKAVEKALQSSPLGINPQPDGEVIRLHIPELTRERRGELTKLVNKYAEEQRVATRNIRREIVDSLKKYQKEFQDITDEAVKKIDAILAEKEHEIMDE